MWVKGTRCCLKVARFATITVSPSSCLGQVHGYVFPPVRAVTLLGGPCFPLSA